MNKLFALACAVMVTIALALMLASCGCRPESPTAEQMIPHFTPAPKDLFDWMDE